MATGYQNYDYYNTGMYQSHSPPDPEPAEEQQRPLTRIKLPNQGEVFSIAEVVTRVARLAEDALLRAEAAEAQVQRLTKELEVLKMTGVGQAERPIATAPTVHRKLTSLKSGYDGDRTE